MYNYARHITQRRHLEYDIPRDYNKEIEEYVCIYFYIFTAIFIIMLYINFRY